MDIRGALGTAVSNISATASAIPGAGVVAYGAKSIAKHALEKGGDLAAAHLNPNSLVWPTH